MAVYKRTYKVYNGPLSPSWSRFAVLTRYSLGTLFTSRLFTAYFVLCFLPFLIGTGYIYFANSAAAQALLGMHVKGSFDIGAMWFATMLQVQTSLGFILVAWGAPGMITRDNANQALQLYFSRPLSRTEYILGKFIALALLLSCITWIPGLMFFGLQAGLAEGGWASQNLFLVPAIFLSSWLWIAVISLLALALSVFVRSRIAATGLFLGVMFVLPGFAQAFDLILRTNWGQLLNISYTTRLVWLELFGIERRFRGLPLQGGIPVWSAWVAILATCLISVLLLNRRLKAREVVRG
jgi:ABC-2 type transport system permease protein